VQAVRPVLPAKVLAAQPVLQASILAVRRRSCKVDGEELRSS
jgi:hypothetical protein